MTGEEAKAQSAAGSEPPAVVPPFPEIRSIKDVLVGDLVARTQWNWVVASVESRGAWSVKAAQKFRYRGDDIWIIPLTQECYGAAAARLRPGLDFAAASKLLMRFLSAVSWVYEQGISLPHGFIGSPRPSPLGRPDRIGGSIMDDFDLSYLPEPANERALLALALMRDGRALGRHPYAYLSFFRALETAIPDGPQRGRWINDNVQTLSGYFAKPAVLKLIATGVQDIALHLRESNRHAVAHAKAEPVIDPDDPEHTMRLTEETPIVQELAALAIEEAFGVETRQTIYRKHLYELAGFKEYVGEEVVRRVMSGEGFKEGDKIDLPDINVGLRDRPPVRPFVKLRAVEFQHHEKSLVVLYRSPDEKLFLQLGLNFGDERLVFEFLTDMDIRDDGTAQGMSDIIEYREFSNALFGNGQLHVYNAETGALLGRKDAYLPVNLIFNPDAAAKELATLRRVEQHRKELEEGKWSWSDKRTWAWDWSNDQPWSVRHT